MRKNNGRRAMAGLLAAMLLACFAGCTAKEDTGVTKSATDPAEVSDSAAQSNEASETSAPEAESQTDVQTDESTTADQGGKQVAFPESQADQLRLYNNALAQSGLSCRSLSQEVAAGKLWMGNKADSFMDLLAPEQGTLLEKFQKAQQGGASLAQLAEESVSDVKISGNNTMTIQMKNLSVGEEIVQGKGGYFNLVDMERTRELVDGVKQYANISGNVKIESASYTLTDGQLTAVFDSSLSKLVSVQFTAKQTVKAEMKYLIMAIHADVQYRLTSSYQ